MAAVMNKRERVERAMAVQETDRVSLYDLLRNDAAFVHFAREALPPFEKMTWIEAPEVLRSLVALGDQMLAAFLKAAG